MTCLAYPERAGPITLSPDGLIQDFSTVGIQLDATRVVHVAAYKPDVGDCSVTRVNVAGVAVGTLDVLPFVVVGKFAGMAVGADVHGIGSSPPHAGT